MFKVEMWKSWGQFPPQLVDAIILFGNNSVMEKDYASIAHLG